MSILAEILSTAGQVEIVDLNAKISEITEQISCLKREVIEFTENTYLKFIPFMEEDDALFRKVQSVSSELDEIQSRIEIQTKRELADSTGELQKLKDELKESDLSIILSNKLLELHKCVFDASNEQDACRFFAASNKLGELECLLNDIDSDLRHLDICDALVDELRRMQTDFSYTVLEKWTPCIKFRESQKDLTNLNKQISLTVLHENLTPDLVKALHYYELLLIEMKKFGDKLMDIVLLPVICNSSTVVIESVEKKQVLLIDVQNNTKVSCINVINSLTLVFNFLFSHFSVVVDDANSVITLLGECIADEFCKQFISKCLDKAVPKHQEERNLYSGVIDVLSNFDKLLHESGFLPDENKQLLEYTDNVDVLITNKICDSYLEAARHLMKKDLHDMIEAGIQYKILDTDGTAPQGYSRKLKLVQDSNSDRGILVSELSSNTYQFPLCQISKSSYEILQLAESLLDETAKSKSNNCSLKLFFAVRNMFKLYCDIVPLYHKKMLETIPQQSALLRNNCYYLAHELMCLGVKFKSQHPETLKNIIITFIDIVDSLRTIGHDMLVNQIEIQRKQILDILRDSGLVTLIENPEFPRGIEKAIRQCNRQLLLLQKVWQPVLPNETYCKSVGALCSVFVQELIDRVCSTGDIPADTATELVRVFSIVQEKTPQVFPEPKEIYQYVIRWTKFNELVRLLGANLRDVDERWSEGKGPLAQEFTAEQVKQLVKALFQISERRTALLSRIK